MGHTSDATGKPTITPTPTQTVADMQAIVDYAEKVGGLLKVTAAQRGALTSGQTRPGWLIAETDTGALFQVTAASPQGVQLPRTAQGSFTLTGSLPSGGNLKRAITFPVGFFTQVPHVHITVSNGRVTPSIDALVPTTKDGASLSFDNWSPGAVGSPPTVWWTAIGI